MATSRVPKALAALGAGLVLATGVTFIGNRDEGYRYSDQCIAIDGDTLHCSHRGEVHKLRLNGIDAPELSEGSRAERSHATLRYLAEQERVYWLPLKKDRYGRTVAQARAEGADLSCAMVLSGQARYIQRWDERGLTADCIQAAQNRSQQEPAP